MTKLTGTALDRAVANALGLKSVHDCEKWGEHMKEYTDTTYGTTRFDIPEGLYSIEEIEKLLADMKATEKQTEKHLKRAIMNRIEEDDDIQDYKKPWVGLTEEESDNLFVEAQRRMTGSSSRECIHIFRQLVETKLKEKNA